MSGTSWHIEQLKKSEDDDRRHRSRCIHYERKRCHLYCGNCLGSSHCRYYREARPNEISEDVKPVTPKKTIITKKTKKKQQLNQKKKSKKTQTNITIKIGANQVSDIKPTYKEKVAYTPKKHSQKEYNNFFPVGCSVIHTSLGKGTVKENRNGKIVVSFFDGKTTTFNIDFCMQRKLLTKAD